MSTLGLVISVSNKFPGKVHIAGPWASLDQHGEDVLALLLIIVFSFLWLDTSAFFLFVLYNLLQGKEYIVSFPLKDRLRHIWGPRFQRIHLSTSNGQVGEIES